MAIADVAIVQEIPQKQEMAKEIICASVMELEHLDQMLEAFIQMGIAQTGVEASQEEVLKAVKKRLVSDAFLYSLTEGFETTFTDDELKVLVTYFRTDVMRKYWKKNADLSAPVFTSMQSLIQEVLAHYPATIETESHDAVITLTEENFAQEVENSELPVVVDAYADWCGPCKMIAPIFSELSNALAGKVKFVKFNVDREGPLAKRLGVSAMPTFFFFKNGQMVGQHVGGMSREDFEKEINAKLY